MYCKLEEDELWLLPQPEGKVILYVPLRSYLAVLKNDILKHIYCDENTQTCVIEKDLSKEISANFNKHPRISLKDLALGEDGSTIMWDLSLSLSNRCNLACIYCHADAGDSSEVLPFEIAKAAIDRLINDCVVRGRHLARLQFAGGGEPALHFSLLREIVEYLKIKCTDAGIKYEAGMATNGVYPEETAFELTNLLTGISLSHDGPKEIFDIHRPMRGGKSAFEIVMRTAEVFRKRSFPFALRSTISNVTIKLRFKYFDFFQNEFPSYSVGIEPLNPQGRGLNLDGTVRPPGEEEFADFLTEAYLRSLKSNFQFHNSTLGKFEVLRVHFCTSIGQPAMTVLPNGEVVACTRAGAPELYKFGKIDTAGNIHIDDFAASRLRKLSVFSSPKCETCFCKYNCGGGCLDLRLSDNLRCTATRKIGMMMLRSKAHLSPEVQRDK